MKILGKASSSTFIVEAGETELANIAGYNYQFPSEKRIDVGSQIEISKLWYALSVERERQDELTKFAASLRGLADKVDKINEALDCPIVEPKR